VISAKVIWNKQATENILKVRFSLFNNRYLKNTGMWAVAPCSVVDGCHI
jgi:hypothetical protein